MFSLESPHGGDSNEVSQYTVFNIMKKITLNCLKSAAVGFFLKGLKNEFETAVVNEPPVFEPVMGYCIIHIPITVGATLQLTVLGCPSNLENSRARPYCACSRCGWGLF